MALLAIKSRLIPLFLAFNFSEPAMLVCILAKMQPLR